MTDFLKIAKLLSKLDDELEELEFEEFFAVICCLIEVKCKQCDKDIVEVADMLADSIKAVNEEFGTI